MKRRSQGGKRRRGIGGKKRRKREKGINCMVKIRQKEKEGIRGRQPKRQGRSETVMVHIAIFY